MIFIRWQASARGSIDGVLRTVATRESNDFGIGLARWFLVIIFLRTVDLFKYLTRVILKYC